MGLLPSYRSDQLPQALSEQDEIGSVSRDVSGSNREGRKMGQGVRLVVVVLGVVALAMAITYVYSSRGLKPLTDQVRKTLPGDFVKLADGYTHYEWRGPKDGPVVVLVHGGTQSSYIWDGVVDKIAEAGFRTLRYDNFGRGYSDRPALKYDADLYDRQLMGLLEALGVKGPVSLVGLSQGGGISVVFASKHPERVKKLVLLAPVGFPINLPFTARLAEAPIIGDWIMAVLGRRVLLAKTGKGFKDRKLAAEIKAKTQEQLDYAGYLPALLSMLRHYPLHALGATYSKLGATGIPTLLIWGEEDNVVPPSNANEVMKRAPHAKLRTLPGCGHTAVYENGDKVAPLIVEFLSK